LQSDILYKLEAVVMIVKFEQFFLLVFTSLAPFILIQCHGEVTSKVLTELNITNIKNAVSQELNLTAQYGLLCNDKVLPCTQGMPNLIANTVYLLMLCSTLVRKYA
jgi:hypothetical protein